MATAIYSLCALTALVCALLLFRAFRRNGYRLLLWSSLCFFGLTLNNLLLVVDKIVLPATDLSLLRAAVAAVAMVVLLYGLIWEAEFVIGLTSVVMGAVAMASFVAAMFFFRYWRQTRDVLFLLFALAFLVDAAMRFLLGSRIVSTETEPLIYSARLVTFAMIIAAIIKKIAKTANAAYGGSPSLLRVDTKRGRIRRQPRPSLLSRPFRGRE